VEHPPITAVVFDMGGVVVRLKPLGEVLAGLELPHEDLWERWIRADAVRVFESGGSTVDEFADSLIRELGVDREPVELIERFRGFPLGLFEGAERLLVETRARCTTAVLSNTNELHWNTQPDHDVLQRSFDHEYLSFRIGVVKPDAAIFEHAVDDLGVDAAQVLFLDDNQVNVDGARAAGLRSELARGPEQARAALVDHGVLDT